MWISTFARWARSLFRPNKPIKAKPENAASRPPKPTSADLSRRHALSRARSIQRTSDAGFPLFSLMASNDERDCAWCKANNGKKFPVNTDINRLIKENCTCEYCRCGIRSHRR